MSRTDAYAVFRVANYRRYFIGNLMGIVGIQMLGIAVGWEVYERTGSNMKLGYIGLAQYLPILLFTLPAGQVADRFNRKVILMLSLALTSAAAFALCWLSMNHGRVEWIYGCLFLIGFSRAFQGPARSALVMQIVPREVFQNAVAWGSNAFEIATVTGPALGGLMIAFFGKATWVYLVTATVALIYIVLLTGVTQPNAAEHREPITWPGFISGLKYVWSSKVITASISLDLFAVLLGGAVTLLPVYAKDILKVGPSGLGWMRAMPSIGAVIMSFVIAHRPAIRNAGRTLLLTVAGFGIATIIFGLSTQIWLSLLMLALVGAFDNISVVIRQTLVQLQTPESLRGRVSAVNSLFIGTSNELGGYESGLVAEYFGPVASVVSGGIGTLLVVGIVAGIWPQLRRYGALGTRIED